MRFIPIKIKNISQLPTTTKTSNNKPIHIHSDIWLFYSVSFMLWDRALCLFSVFIIVYDKNIKVNSQQCI